MPEESRFPLETNRKVERAKALRAIKRGDIVVYDVAANYDQLVGNVKHMSWFVDAVADELSEEQPQGG
jgi:hypothetical protein